MLQINEAPISDLAPTQATELSQLVDLEACWENMRKPSSGHDSGGINLKDLSAKQKAYEAFRAKMAAYNSQYKPAHIPELLLNSPSRLGGWCRTMRNLYARIAEDPRCHRPAHVLEKAYRWADQIGVRLNKARIARTPPPATIEDVIKDLEAIMQWCDEPVIVAYPVAREELLMTGT